jgi:Carboxypeptidase regulatory-like domain
MRVSALPQSPALLLAASVALFVAAGSSAAAQGRTHTVSGVVRGSVNDEPLAGALIDLRATDNPRSARSDQFGVFEINAVAPGTYRMTVRRIGYAELTRELIVADHDTALMVVLVRRAMLLDTMRVKANVTAIYGLVGTSLTLMPLQGASVLVVGAGKAETTDSGGRFFVPLKRPGSYLLRVAKPGYSPLQLTIDVPTERSVETSALLDTSSAATRPNTDKRWEDFDRRVEGHAMNSALVTSRELEKFESQLFSEAIKNSPSFAKRGMKLGNSACVFINGSPRPGLALDVLRVEDVQAVELYGANGDPTLSLSSDWPSGAACTEVTGGIRSPQRPATGTVIFANVWLKP